MEELLHLGFAAGEVLAGGVDFGQGQPVEGIIRHDAHGFDERGHGVVEFAEVRERVAEIEPRRAHLRLEGRGLGQAGNGVAILFIIHEDIAEVVPGERIVRMLLGFLLGEHEGLLKLVIVLQEADVVRLG